MSKDTLLPAHMPEPWVRVGAVIETEDGRHVATLRDADVDTSAWERPADVAGRIVDCVNALEGCARPAQTIEEARYALALAAEWLEKLGTLLDRAGFDDIFEDALKKTGRDSRGLETIRAAADALGRTSEEHLARELMTRTKPRASGTPCRDCSGTGEGGPIGLPYKCAACNGTGHA